jgi:TldD protein
MKRRDFIKVTAKGSALALSSPIIVELIGARAAAAAELQWDSMAGAGFEMDLILAEALSRGGQFAEVYLEETIRTGIRVSDSTIESVQLGSDRGGGVRVINGWKTGYAFCDSWDTEDLKRSAGIASRIGSPGKAAAEVRPSDLKASPARGTTSYDLDPSEVLADAKVKVVETADRVAREYDPAIKQVRIDYRDEIRRMVVFNSEGVAVRQETPLVWLSIDLMAERGDRRAPGYVRRSSKSGFEYATEEFAREAAEEGARQAVVMLDASDAPSGEMPVVIASGGGVVFHEAVGHGLEADGVERGTSFYTGLVGERVGSDLVTIVEDGSVPHLRGSFDYDDEGTPSRRNVLIEKGVLRGYMSDWLTANKLGIPLTGNGRRQSYMHYPLVRMTNTFILDGRSDPEEIISGTPKGLYALRLGGGEVDTTTGNFTFGVREAYLIENGKITSPVRGATLIGNGPEILKRIDMVGNDTTFWPGTCGKGQWVPVSSGAPTLRIAGINVGGTA